MRTNATHPRASNSPKAQSLPVFDLVALACISAACVALMALSVITNPDHGLPIPQLDRLTVSALLCTILLIAGATVLEFIRSARRTSAHIRSENVRLEQRAVVAERIIKAEPQVLIYWEPGEPLSVIAHALTTVPGLPENHRDLLRFGMWLEADAAANLKAHLDGLFESGQAFSIILKTRAGGYLEAEGRTAGGRAILKMRDCLGYKRDMARILDQYQTMRRDLEGSRALLDCLPSPVWMKSADGRISWVNRAYRLAVDATQLREVEERQIELLEQRQRQAVDRSVEAQTPFRERLQLLVAGEKKAHQIVVIPVSGGQAAVALDVAAVEQAQGELDRQSAAFERTLDKVATAVAIFAPDRRLAYCNEAFQKLWQLDADWLKSQPTEGAILDRMREANLLPEDRNYREWKARFLMRIRTEANTIEQWHLPDGRTLQVLAENRGDGGIAYLFVDQTERLALESRFNQQINAQRETLDSLQEGVAVFGINGRLKLQNAAFNTIWKLSDDIAAAKPHIDDVIVHARTLHDEPGTWAAISRAVTNFSEQRMPLVGTMQRADQSLIAYTATPLPDGATLLTFRDITDAKRYERALEERNEALITADRLKSQFIGHVSYELRTPLTNIIGFNELLSSPLIGSLNPKQREYLSDITSSSKTLLSIIDDILDLATIDAGALELKLGPVDVARVLDAAIEGVRDRAIQAKLTLDIGQAEDATVFVADEARVRQVLYNLVSNAVGFSKAGDTVEITAWRANGEMRFSVEDQGVGVPVDQQARVFERFESRSQGSKHRGAGLGLSIVKSLIDIHGGTVAFESQPGRGTKVTVAFPERLEALGLPDLDQGRASDAMPATPTVYIPGLKQTLG